MGSVKSESDPSTTGTNDSDPIAAAAIGVYLVIHTMVLVALCVIVWLASDWAQFFDLMPWMDAPERPLTAQKFDSFQKLVISACAAGLGGGVFMIREFYIKFAYGRRAKESDPKEYLRGKEIPRYVLLPFSAMVLGPISLALAKAGAITFAGLSQSNEVPMFTLVALSFVMGFAYHDTLAGLTKLSRGIFDSRSSQKKTEA